MAYGIKPSRNQRAWSRRAGWSLVLGLVGACAQGSNGAGAEDDRGGWQFQALSRLYPQDAATLRRLALAHALTRGLTTDSEQQGEITSEELTSWTNYHWAQVDRPAVFRTLHAVVRVKPDAATSEVEKAQRVAQAIHAAVSGAPDAEAFKERSKQVATEGLEVKVEGLDFVAEDGRVMRLGAKPSAQAGSYDPAFARAAAALGSVGQISPVTRTSFGFHVLRLEETLPAVRFDEAARRALAWDDVIERRARRALQSLLESERQQASPVIERSADEATAKVSVQ